MGVNVDDELQATAMGLLRRLQPACVRTSYDVRATTVARYAVGQCCRLPVSCARWAELHEWGVCDALPAACRYGVAWGDDEARTLAVPADADAGAVATAIVSLLACERRTPRRTCSACRSWPPRTRGRPACAARDVVRPYEVSLDDDGVVLTRVPDGEAMRADRSVSLDDVNADDVARDEETSALWTHAWCRPLYDRLRRRSEGGDAHARIWACVQEVQGRRVSEAGWSLGGMVGVANLSSLGLATLLALAWRHWAGARDVRVFMAPTGAAVVGYVSAHDGGYRLVDPTLTSVNAFQLAEGLRGDMPHVTPLQEGQAIEVWCRCAWNVAFVESISPASHMRAMLLDRPKAIYHDLPFSSGTWRRLPRDESSNVDRVLRPLIARARKRGRDVARDDDEAEEEETFPALLPFSSATSE